jgi:glycosyltransferase involved in cell wall biosynthesis
VTAPSLVTVVIPAHNASATIETQLAALAEQDYDGRWEVVVVDNGSTDGTIGVVERWRDRVPALRVVDASERTGPGYARNVGAEAAHGDFLVYCDADDMASPQWLTAMATAAVDHDVVGGPLDDRRLNDAVTRQWRPAPPVDELPVVQQFLPATASANLGIWRATLAAIGGWREDYRTGYEDVELCWRAQLRGYRLGFAPEAVMAYRYRPSLRAFARQSYGYGRMTPRLYREFRQHGMPRSDLRTALGAWKWAVLHLLDVPRSPVQRGVWVRIVATRIGRLVGSLQHRVFFV